jgi:ketosteroid isomerase-like protein
VDAAEQVRRLYTAYERRDWADAASYLHELATVKMPATGEELVGRDGVIDFQRSYPEPWGHLTVRRVIGGSEEAVAEVEIVAEERFGMAAFWRRRDGLLHEGVEYWVTVGGDTPTPGRRTAFAGAR